MKLLQLLIKISLVVSWSLVTADVARSQSGNMSDITGVDPVEAVPEPDLTDTTGNSGDNSGNTSVTSSEETNTADTGDTTVTSSEETNTADTRDTTVTSSEETNTADTRDTTVTSSEETNTADTGETTATSSEETNTADTEKEKELIAQEEEEEETVTQEEEEEETVAQEEEEEETVAQEDIPRDRYELAIQESNTPGAIEKIEEFQVQRLINSSGIGTMYGQVPTTKQISRRLGELWQQTAKKPAFINISLQSNQLEAFVVLPTLSESAQNNTARIASAKITPTALVNPSQATIRKTVRDTSRRELLAIATQFREEVSNSRKLRQATYMKSARQLYQTLIKPIEAELEANDIDVLVFSMDSGLRLLPLAALHDGQQFLIEKYAIALVPSFGLTDTRYVNLNHSRILAMGASEFPEQAPLPTMPIELNTIISDPRQGELFINEQFTVSNFKAQNRRSDHFPIIHLGTHAEFKVGHLDESYIQFYDEKLELSELRSISDELGWNSNTATPIELLVLSACETALGDEKAELGFAGLAVQAGVKSALASLWYISDLGTLALMSEFYDQLDDTLIKAEALRQTQLGMLKGKVKVSDRHVELSNGQNLQLPSEFPQGTLELSHPYFWSAFTLIGNWN